MPADHDSMTRSPSNARRSRRESAGCTPGRHLVVWVVAVIASLVLGACGGEVATTQGASGATQATGTLGTPVATALPPYRPDDGSTRPPSTTTSSTPQPSSTSHTSPALVTTSVTKPATSTRPSYAVATTTLALVDTSRPSVSHGVQVSASRALTTTVYYPSDADGPWPLVVFAHGYRIGPGPYARICRMWASRGYVVAAPSFPLTDVNVAGANLDEGDLPNQAADVSFVIDNLLGSPGSSGELAGRIDSERIGVAGHSDGADTALDIGYFPGRTDARIRAVVAMSADAMRAPGGSVGAATPLLVTHGDRDSITPFSNGTTVFGQVHAHRFFVELLGADHLPPVTGAPPWTAVLDDVTTDFLDRYVAGRTASDDAIMATGNHSGVSSIKQAG